MSVHVISNGDDIKTPVELYFSGEPFENQLHITEVAPEENVLRVAWPHLALTVDADLEIREHSFSKIGSDLVKLTYQSLLPHPRKLTSNSH